MKEIKFRGKDVDNNWVYGTYQRIDNNINNPFGTTIIDRHFICSYFAGDWNLGGWENVEVNIDTVCQYTGLKDKNDKEIYERDIIKATCRNGGNDTDGFWEVIYDEGAFSAKVNVDYTPPLYALLEIEVIGNIYDNPEILNKE